MPAVSYNYNPGDTVYCLVTDNCGQLVVKEAVVRTVNIDINVTLTVDISYDVVYTQSASSTTIDQDNVYPDVDSALTAYRAEVLG